MIKDISGNPLPPSVYFSDNGKKFIARLNYWRAGKRIQLSKRFDSATEAYIYNRIITNLEELWNLYKME